MGKKSKKTQNDKAKKKAGTKKGGLKALGNLIQDEVDQLSQRHEATLKRLLILEQRLDEQLEQLSQRHESVLKRLLELEKRVGE
jgi:uncharacterized HAD superfamily protein